ncbi:MAG: hypothetical protein QXT63_09880, partial [Thermoplasmata archaeon]
GYLSSSEVSVLSVFIPYYKAWFKNMVGRSSENLLKINERAYEYSFDKVNVSTNFTGSIYELRPIEIEFLFMMNMLPSLVERYSFYNIELMVRNDTHSINYTYVVKINEDYEVYEKDSYSNIEFTEFMNESGCYLLLEPKMGTDEFLNSEPTKYRIYLKDTVKPVIVTQNIIYVEQGANFTLNAVSSVDNCYEGVVEYNWTVEIGKIEYVYIEDRDKATTLASINVPGYYNITLKIRDYAGNENSTIVQIRVIDTIGPKVGIIGKEHANEDEEIEFSSNTTDNDIAYPFGYAYTWQIFSNATNL